MENNYAVYIMTNYSETTFYIGVTSNLKKEFLNIKIKSLTVLQKNTI